jgi:NAD-dependent deacetylase
MDKYKQLKEIIEKSEKIVLFTGAGISVPSGIPDFRSDNGLYNEKTDDFISPEQIISHSYFMFNPKKFFEFYGNKMVYKKAKPNLAHEYFARLDNVIVVTQNIDNLHQEAGSKIVYELHGSVKRNYCMKCRKYYDLDDINEKEVNYCNCGGIIKPDVVLYEEPLDDKVVYKAIEAINSCDTLIVVGTSLTVYPAAAYLRYFRGENLILINKSKTQYDHIANLVFNEDVVEVINKIK